MTNTLIFIKYNLNIIKQGDDFINTYIIAGIILGIAIILFPVRAQIFTLSFLPSSLNMFNGNPDSNTTKFNLFELLEIFVNYILAALVNIIDFLLIFINWIAPLKALIDYIYRSPDKLEKSIPTLFGGRKGHRNIITHSVINPVFLVFIFLSSKMCNYLSSTPLYIVKYLFILIGICFTCHLLCDTMPKHWRGFSNIKIFIFKNIHTLSSGSSKLWLYINSILSLLAIHKYLWL